MRLNFTKNLAFLFLFFLIVSCNESSNSNAISCPAVVSGDSASMSNALSTISTIENVADNISSTQLTVAGDSFSDSQSGADFTVSRHIPASIDSGTFSTGTYTARLFIPSDVFTGLGASTIDNDRISFSTNILSDYYAPGDSWHSPLVAYRLIDFSSSSPVEITSLNSSGDPVDVTMPCDTSSCTSDCTCQCYHWNFTTDRWTQNEVTTTQGSGNVTCSSYLPAAYLTVFAVPTGCE